MSQTQSKQLNQIATTVLTANLRVTSQDSVLIVTDPLMRAEAELWQANAKKLTNKVKISMLKNMTENAQEPPSSVLEQMLASSVILLQTTYSLSHTKARQQACETGARIASLPTVTLDIIERTLSANYIEISQLSLSLQPLLSKATSAHLTSVNGTDLNLSLNGRQGIADTGFYPNPGDFGNLPAGETFIAPVEGTAEGTVIVDGSFAGLELDKPIKLEIVSGQVTTISGGKAAQTLKNQIKAAGEKARNIAELGIGTNPAANPTGELIEAEKAFGTVHIALGNNATIGGSISVPFHSDGVILSPTLSLDGKMILENGHFKL